MAPKHTNSEQVTIAWLKVQSDLSGIPIGTTVPQDTSSWAATGFIQISVVGRGHSNPEIDYRSPVMTAFCWATNPNKQNPPWGKANDLADIIWDICGSNANGRENLTTAVSAAPKARVLQAWGVQEPRRHKWGFPTLDTGAVVNQGNTALYTTDFEIAWVEL